jgi:hypothetical protein
MQKVKNVFLFLFLSVSFVATNTQALAYCEDCDCCCEESDCTECADCDCADCEDCNCESCENCGCEYGDCEEDCDGCECGDCDGCECGDCEEDCTCDDCADCECEDGDEYDGNYYAYRQGEGSGEVDIERWDSCDDMEEYIPEGATIRVEGGIDVYIVKYMNGKMFKRLVLNPEVFENYEHLSWEDVMNVSPDVLDSFITSDLVRSDDSGKVYKLYPSDDHGTKRMVAYHGDYWYCIDWDSVYTINGYDEDSYTANSTIY